MSSPSNPGGATNDGKRCTDAADPAPEAELAAVARAMTTLDDLDEWCRRAEVTEMAGLCACIVAARFLSRIAWLIEGASKAFRVEWDREVDWQLPTTLSAFRLLAWRTRDDLYSAVGQIEPVSALASSHHDLLRYLSACRALRDTFDRDVYHRLLRTPTANAALRDAVVATVLDLEQAAHRLSDETRAHAELAAKEIRGRREQLSTG